MASNIKIDKLSNEIRQDSHGEVELPAVKVFHAAGCLAKLDWTFWVGCFEIYLQVKINDQ